jgi:hypothetical protein
MSIRITIPDELGRYCDGRCELAIEATTFDGIVTKLIERYPDVGPRLLGREARLLSHLIVFHNGTSVPTAKLAELAVAPNDELEIMFLASGG